MRGMAQRVDSRDIAGDLTFPVLVVAGQDDALLGPAQAEGVRAAFPQADLRVMAGCGHVPMLEDPQGLSAVLEAFLVPRPGASERGL